MRLTRGGAKYQVIPATAFGGEITGLRRQLGWPQSRVAEALGVSVRTLSRWESGRAVPTQADLIKRRLIELLQEEHAVS